MGNKFKISDYTKCLTKAEKDFLKDTIKNGKEYGGFGRMTTDAEGKPYNGWFSAYIPTSSNFRMLQEIWKKMNQIKATHIINYAPTPFKGDVLLINEKCALNFEKWAKREDTY